MILFHAGTREIRKPDIHLGRKNADFGWGFYLTADPEFTFRWARDNAVVNEYELDLTGLSVRRFSRDAEWFSYIFHNRRFEDSLSADVVIGPVANDTLFDTLGLLTSGYLDPQDALRLLKIGPEYTQVALKTEKAAAQLRWIRAEGIPRMEEDERRKEQDAYLEAFASALETILEKGGDEPCSGK